MRMMLLGASKAQINAVNRVKEMGHTCITSDYNSNPPAAVYSDIHCVASTFSPEETLEEAIEKEVEGVFTTGTDQPVLTAAIVADQLNLPSFLDVPTARSVTNKAVMKKKFVEAGLPTIPYHLYRKGDALDTISLFSGPIVVKPLDSQGQRGVFRLENVSELSDVFDDVICYSREKDILVEAYYESDEVTVSGWVKNGCVQVLSMTDRVTFEINQTIGVCSSHEYPSKYTQSHGEQCRLLTQKIVKAFGIQEGPIYFQYLIGGQGVLINEIACRIGGAYEELWLKDVCGFDLLKAVIAFSSGSEYEGPAEQIMPVKGMYRSVQLFFGTCGPIASMTPVDEMLSLPYVDYFGYNYQEGDVIKEIENATARAGYAVITGNSKQELMHHIKDFYAHLRINDLDGNNKVIWRNMS